jgi:Uma2 family endonuclease
VILLRYDRRFFTIRGPVTKDAHLVIEVSDSSIQYDRGPKLHVYARHGVREVWIEDLTSNVLLVLRDPVGNTYQSRLTLKPGETISPLAFPHLVIPVSGLLNLDFDT